MIQYIACIRKSHYHAEYGFRTQPYYYQQSYYIFDLQMLMIYLYLKKY